MPIRYITDAMRHAHHPHSVGRSWGSRPAALVLIGAAMIVLPGCQSSPIAPPPKAVEAYDEGDYARAYRDATAEYSRTSGERKDMAALMAGLSAHAMGNYTTSAEWLAPLVNHADREISGRAAATLGLIEADRGDHAAAAAHLSMAGRKLTGEAAAQANFQAAESYAALGRVDAARLHYRLAAATTGDTNVDALVDERLSLDAYTVQVGAFSSRENAMTRVGEIRRRAEALGLGAPRVVLRPGPGGRSLYLVQLGSYKTQSEASAARVRLGGDAVVAHAE